MRYAYIDTKAIRFQTRHYAINVFWHDLISGRGKRFFFAQLKKGIKVLLTDKWGG